MSGPSLNQNFNQTQTLAPQMRQSLEVLQANTLELQQLLQQFLETNPVLEHELASVSLDELDSKASDPDPLLESPDDDLRELAIIGFSPCELWGLDEVSVMFTAWVEAGDVSSTSSVACVAVSVTSEALASEALIPLPS